MLISTGRGAVNSTIDSQTDNVTDHEAVRSSLQSTRAEDRGSSSHAQREQVKQFSDRSWETHFDKMTTHEDISLLGRRITYIKDCENESLTDSSLDVSAGFGREQIRSEGISTGETSTSTRQNTVGSAVMENFSRSTMTKSLDMSNLTTNLNNTSITVADAMLLPDVSAEHRIRDESIENTQDSSNGSGDTSSHVMLVDSVLHEQTRQQSSSVASNQEGYVSTAIETTHTSRNGNGKIMTPVTITDSVLSDRLPDYYELSIDLPLEHAGSIVTASVQEQLQVEREATLVAEQASTHKDVSGSSRRNSSAEDRVVDISTYHKSLLTTANSQSDETGTVQKSTQQDLRTEKESHDSRAFVSGARRDPSTDIQNAEQHLIGAQVLTGQGSKHKSLEGMEASMSRKTESTSTCAGVSSSSSVFVENQDVQESTEETRHRTSHRDICDASIRNITVNAEVLEAPNIYSDQSVSIRTEQRTALETARQSSKSPTSEFRPEALDTVRQNISELLT